MENDEELIEQERMRREEILRRLKAGKARVAELEAQLDAERNKWQAILTRLELAAGPITQDTSDGYHTFAELYDHRHALWMAVCWFRGESWRTHRHDDGQLAFGGGWFVLGLKSGSKQITYHLPDALWDACYFAEELDKAPPFDGHTSADVLQRVRDLIP